MKGGGKCGEKREEGRNEKEEREGGRKEKHKRKDTRKNIYKMNSYRIKKLKESLKRKTEKNVKGKRERKI